MIIRKKLIGVALFATTVLASNALFAAKPPPELPQVAVFTSVLDTNAVPTSITVVKNFSGRIGINGFDLIRATGGGFCSIQIVRPLADNPAGVGDAASGVFFEARFFTGAESRHVELRDPIVLENATFSIILDEHDGNDCSFIVKVRALVL